MNTSDGNYIGYLLATIHTLDIFSTSKSATIKNAHQARIQAITATVCESWLKTLKEWGAKKVETGLNQPLIYIHPSLPLSALFYFPLFNSVAKKKNYS